MYLLLYDYVDDVLERRGPFRDEHLARLREWQADGRITLAGAIGDPPVGAAIVFDVDAAEHVHEFADGDPYVHNGLVLQRRVYRWTLV